MADDIVERLRVDCECYDGDTCVHAAAADEIRRLRRWTSVLVAKEIVRLRCDNGELRTRIEELEARRER